MKRIIVLLCLLFTVTEVVLANGPGSQSSTCTSGSACSTIDCSNPNTGFTYGVGRGQFAYCDYSDTVPISQGEACAYIYSGGTYANQNIVNCMFNPANAPVNAGLIFLLIVGGGFGAFFLRKEHLNKKSQIAL